MGSRDGMLMNLLRTFVRVVRVSLSRAVLGMFGYRVVQ